MRAGFLRVLLSGFEQRGIVDQKTFHDWVEKADFERDVKGQFRFENFSIGYAGFRWLQIRCGIKTVKPNVHITRFIERIIKRTVSPEEAVDGLIQVAKLSNRKANRLDAAIWLFERRDPNRTINRGIPPRR